MYMCVGCAFDCVFMCGVCEFMWDVVRVSGRVCICAVCVVKVCVCVWGVFTLRTRLTTDLQPSGEAAPPDICV